MSPQTSIRVWGRVTVRRISSRSWLLVSGLRYSSMCFIDHSSAENLIKANSGRLRHAIDRSVRGYQQTTWIVEVWPSFEAKRQRKSFPVVFLELGKQPVHTRCCGLVNLTNRNSRMDQDVVAHRGTRDTSHVGFSAHPREFNPGFRKRSIFAQPFDKFSGDGPSTCQCLTRKDVELPEHKVATAAANWPAARPPSLRRNLPWQQDSSRIRNVAQNQLR